MCRVLYSSFNKTQLCIERMVLFKAEPPEDIGGYERGGVALWLSVDPMYVVTLLYLIDGKII